MPGTAFSSCCTQLGSRLCEISAKYCMIPTCDHDYRSKYSIHIVGEKECLYHMQSYILNMSTTFLFHLPTSTTTDNSPVIKSDTPAAQKD